MVINRRSSLRSVVPALIVGLLAQVVSAQQAARQPDVIFVPTPQKAVETMLALARVGPQDVVYDLGSGDGRIVVTAARDHGARGVGVDISPDRVREGRALARKHGVDELVRFIEGDLFEADISQASVVTLYLLPTLNVRLRPRLLEELRPGSRVVSFSFTMDDWKPDQIARAAGDDIYLWVIPASVDGRWELEAPSGDQYVFDLRQRYQQVEGTIIRNGVKQQIRTGSVNGHMLRLTTDRRFEARVEGHSITLIDPNGRPVATGRRTGEPHVGT